MSVWATVKVGEAVNVQVYVGVIVNVGVCVRVPVNVGVTVLVIMIKPTQLEKSWSHLPTFWTPVGENVGVDVNVDVFVLVNVGVREFVLVMVGVQESVPTGLNTATATELDDPYEVLPVL